MSALIVGSIALDTIETPLEKRVSVLGGSCVFASVAASFFVKPKIVGVVGEDFDGDYLARLKKRGVDTAGVTKVKGKTFHWEGKYHPDMKTRDTIKTELNVFADFDPVLPEEYKKAKYLFLANIEPSLQLKVLNQASQAKFKMLDTMNLWIDIAKDKLTEVLKKVDCVVLNDEEIRQFSGVSNLVAAAKEILKLGPKYVIVKKGEHGASIIGEKLYFSLPSYPVENVVDPTGAGDSFAGAFIGYIAKKDRVNDAVIRKAIVYGNAVASFTVEAFSVEKLEQLTLERVNDRIKQLKKMVVF